jgi:hypothetical protein
MVVMIEVKPYLKADGYRTRYWAVYVDGDLLAVVLYRKGAQAIADMFALGSCRKEAEGAA